MHNKNKMKVLKDLFFSFNVYIKVSAVNEIELSKHKKEKQKNWLLGKVEGVDNLTDQLLFCLCLSVCPAAEILGGCSFLSFPFTAFFVLSEASDRMSLK